jgi:hypothetical protein
MSLHLKSRTQCPPGGFIVTIGKLPEQQFWSFSEAVAWYQNIARANPAMKLLTDPAAVASFIDQQNAIRVSLIPGAAAYLQDSMKGGPVHSPTKKAWSPGRLSPSVSAAAADIKTAAAGMGLLMEWLISGSPSVAPELAEQRALACVACPLNAGGHWWTEAPAETIRALLSKRAEPKLETPHDDKLLTCKVCQCWNSLKVHVPMETIAGKTKPETMAKFPPNCWIVKETQPPVA